MVGRPWPPGAREYLDLLDRRLRALSRLAEGSRRGLASLSSRAGHAVARRFLKPLEGRWDDGDENLVRGYLDRWVRSGEDPRRAAARSLAEAALALGRMEARRETLWFFLWEMESLLAGMDAGRGTPRESRPAPGRRSC